MKHIWILTLFPDFVEAFLNCGVIGQVLKGHRKISLGLTTHVLDIRDYALNNYKGVDDSPYGGGPGMVMRADVLFHALDKGVRQTRGLEDFSSLHVVYTTPRGQVWSRDKAMAFAQKHFLVPVDNEQPSCRENDLVFICGRYEGIDERFLDVYVDEYISLGDFVLSGGELAVMSLLDSSLRFLPGSLGNNHSFQQDSFEQGLIEYPQYTKPRCFQGQEVPDVLTSGHHKKIQEFQFQKQKELTQKFRPDLWKNYLKQQERGKS